jgi:hypothetical protein
LNYAHIHELQQQDKQLLALQVKYPDKNVILQLDDNLRPMLTANALFFFFIAETVVCSFYTGARSFG